MADKKVSDLPSLNGADVDAADLLYIVDSSAGAAGSKKITVGQYQLAPVSGGTANTVVYLNGSKVESSSSALTFDGTNLGIGTSSPGAKLDVSGSVNAVQARFGNVAGRGLEIGTSIISGTNDAGSVLNAKGATSGTMIFQTDSTERMRLDSSGNLGLGVTPSAWGSNYKAFESAGNSSVAIAAANINGINIASNTYNDNTNWIYKTTGAAARYSVNTGVHQWYTAPSGTAGNAITFTQAMTLDASGNLGLGVTSISGFRADILSTSTDAAIRARTSNNNEVLRVESAGTATSSIRFINTSVNNTYISADGTALTFLTAATENARITSGGDLLVGTTDAAINSGTGVKLKAGANNNVNAVGSDSTNTTSNYNLYSTGAAAYRFYVGMGGTIYATSTTITAISDQRLKENIRDLDAGLSEIMALKPRKFDWKAGKGKDKKGDRGWIAQEFEQVFPDMVDTWQDPAPEGEEPYKAVNADLIPVLVKAIQEQQALITDLRARVAALEAK